MGRHVGHTLLRDFEPPLWRLPGDAVSMGFPCSMHISCNGVGLRLFQTRDTR